MRDLSAQSLGISGFETIGKVTIYLFLSILALMLLFAVITGNRGKCLYSVWYNISFMTIIHWIALINVDDYSEFESFFEEIAVIFRPFSLSAVCDEPPITVHVYSTMKIYSNGFINNAKELLIIYFSVMLFCIIIIIAGKYSKSEKLQNLKKQVKYSMIIRLHLILFLDIMTFSLIDLNFYNENSSCSSLNLGLSLFFLLTGGCWIMIIPVIIKVKMNKDQENHHDVVFENIETLVNEFKPCFQTTKYQYYTIYLLYRMSLAFSLVVLSKSPSVQLFIIALFQVIISNLYLVFYIVLAKPFRYRRDAITVLCSEVLCLVLVIFIGIRSLNSISATTKANTSAICVFLIWLTEAIIVIRYVLAISSNTRNALEPMGQETASAAVVPTLNVITENGRDGNLKAFTGKESDLGKSIDSDNQIEIYQPKEFYNQSKKLNPTEINFDSVSKRPMAPSAPSEIDKRIERFSGINQRLDDPQNTLNNNTLISSNRGFIDPISLSPRKRQELSQAPSERPPLNPTLVPNPSILNALDSATNRPENRVFTATSSVAPSRRMDINPITVNKFAANTSNIGTSSVANVYANASFQGSVRENESVGGKNVRFRGALDRLTEVEAGRRENDSVVGNYPRLGGPRDRPSELEASRRETESVASNPPRIGALSDRRNDLEASNRVNESLTSTNSRFDRSKVIEERKLATILEKVNASEIKFGNKGLGFN